MLRHDIQQIAFTLADDLDLKPIEVLNVDKYKHYNVDSEKLYMSLTEDEKQEIQDLNSIDYKIYSQLRNKEFKKTGVE